MYVQSYGFPPLLAILRNDEYNSGVAKVLFGNTQRLFCGLTNYKIKCGVARNARKYINFAVIDL